MAKHTLVATVQEGPATLNRVLSLFRQRSFAIESLSIGRTHEPGIMRLTMVVDGARSAVEQVVKQLYKVIEVRKVSDLTEDPRVERELALVKVSCKTAAQRAEVMQMADIYRARVVDVAIGSLTVEVTGPTDKVDSLVELLRVYGVKELVRTGVVAMARGQAVGKTDKPQLRAVS
jgi:acetolactate synthase-1/3 small subunit